MAGKVDDGRGFRDNTYVRLYARLSILRGDSEGLRRGQKDLRGGWERFEFYVRLKTNSLTSIQYERTTLPPISCVSTVHKQRGHVIKEIV